VDVICAIHLIEHFYEWEAEGVLVEWRRVLKYGGRLILELPNMDKVFRYIGACLVSGSRIEEQMTYWPFWGDPRSKQPGMCHKWGYTPDSMRALLEVVGFRRIQQAPAKYHVPVRDMRFEAIK